MKVEYYPSGGKKMEAGVDRHGLLDGRFKSYFENGQLAHEGKYKSGLKMGLHRQYYEDGKLKDEFIYKIFNDKELLVEKKKYAPDGLIFLHAKNVERNFDIRVQKSEAHLGDTVKVSIKLLNPTYENSLAIIASFDENLNVADSSVQMKNFIDDNDDHEVLVEVLPKEVGENKFTGLFRDFSVDLIPGSDSLGYRIAEDSFFEFLVIVEDTASM
jgi:hypothetical protein